MLDRAFRELSATVKLIIWLFIISLNGSTHLWKWLRCLTTFFTNTQHTPTFRMLIQSGKLLFGNDNSYNGDFAICSHVGISENSLWVWEAERCADKAGGSAWWLWCTVVPLAIFSVQPCGLASTPRPSSQPSSPAPHRRRTSLACVNISLGLFLEAQKDKIPLEITELTQNNDEESEELWKNH